MFDMLSLMPLGFWLTLFLLLIGLLHSAKTIKTGIGIPTAVVLCTIAAWYVGDVLYNDYVGTHMNLFSTEVLRVAWLQVALFLLIFLLLTPRLHARFSQTLDNRGSQLVKAFSEGVRDPSVQRSLTVSFCVTGSLWIALVAGAWLHFRESIIFYLFPYFGNHPGPWVTTGIGGAKDSLLALANYFQLLIGATFGVIAALSTNPLIRSLAMIGVILTWPYYIFDRTRKFILAVTVPGLLAWVCLRLRCRALTKLTVLGIFFLIINAWFGFVIGNRLETRVVDAFLEEKFDFTEDIAEKHQGLNMFEELAWITALTSEQIYEPQIGANYFANLVNPIPRALWPGKPTIGLDYAVARGMGGADTDAGVYATLSNGVIGQGVVNGGLYLGAAIAAVLMSLWACWLARIDLQGDKVGFLPLYFLGLILTFNLGRDITFLELYPFVFGYAICWVLSRYTGKAKGLAFPSRARGEGSPAEGAGTNEDFSQLPR